MSQNQNKIYSLISLAQKAGKVKSGEFSTDKSVKSFGAFLVIVPNDASDNTKKMFTNMCEFYQVPMYVFGTKEELGHMIGKQMRSSVAITDEGFAKTIMKHLDEAAKNTEEV